MERRKKGKRSSGKLIISNIDICLGIGSDVCDSMYSPGPGYRPSINQNPPLSKI